MLVKMVKINRHELFLIICPQVQAQLLQFAAKNIGLNPALLTSPINPQHMTLLNQLYQLQLVSLSPFRSYSHKIFSGRSRLQSTNRTCKLVAFWRNLPISNKMSFT